MERYSDQVSTANKKSSRTLLSLQASLELQERLLCLRTAEDRLDIFVLKADNNSEKFLKSTLNDPVNSSLFQIVDNTFPTSESWEIDQNISSVLVGAILYGLNQQVKYCVTNTLWFPVESITFDFQGWINFGFPQELEGRRSPTAKLLVKMKEFPSTSKRATYDAIIVEFSGARL